MKYQIPFSYTVNSTIYIEASDLASAIDKAEYLAKEQDGTCKILAYNTSTVDFSSIKIDTDLAEDLNPKKTYTVKLVRTQTVEVEVEAHSAEEAEQVAIDGAEDGSLDDFSNCIDEEIVAEEVEEN